MKINILDQKYKIGCGRGMGVLENPQAVIELNKVIDWENCGWPEDKTQSPTKEKVEVIQDQDEVKKLLQNLGAQQSGGLANTNILMGDVFEENGKLYKWVERYPENKKFLGDNPKLEPGNCFEFQGQIIAVDKNPKTDDLRLVLMISETGPMALERIYKEHIHLEYIIFKKEIDLDINISGHSIIPPEECIVFFNNPGETDLEGLDQKNIPEDEKDNLLDIIWGSHKIVPEVWRLFKKEFPKVIELMGDNIMEITCAPTFEPITVFLNKRGRLVYSLGDFDEEDFELIIVPSLYPNLYNYFKTI